MGIDDVPASSDPTRPDASPAMKILSLRHAFGFRLPHSALLAFCLVLASFAAPVRAATASYDFQTLDDPAAAHGTYVYGISGGNIVGYYFDADFKTHGFLYDGATYTTLDDPAAAPGTTTAQGISDGNIVGSYTDANGANHGFLYDGTTYTTLDDPNAVAASGGTQATGISGGNIVGSYADGNGTQHGFLYNGTSYTTLNDPKATPTDGGTQASGVSGDNIVGSYYGAQATVNGFLLIGKTYTPLKNPAADADTAPLGISGGNIVGFYVDADGVGHGFFYNGKTYAALDHPDANGDTSANGIDGGNIVGWYIGTDGIVHGFLATPPGSGGSSNSGGNTSAPAITNPPANVLVLAGQSAAFTVSASGDPAPTYQWQFKGKSIKGATSSTYAITKVAAANAGNYTVVVTNGIGDPVTSAVATLTLGIAPKITVSPAAKTVDLSQSTFFKVTATGTPAPTIQWQSAPAGSTIFSNLTNGGDFSNVTTANLTVSNITSNLSGTQFRAVATNVIGNTTSTATSKVATLSVNLPVNLADLSAVAGNQTLQSLFGGNLTVSAGTPVTFSANATGTALKYQWQLNGVNLKGATKATYSIAKTAAASSGSYTVSVTNAFTNSPATAGPFTLNVLTKPVLVTPLKATSAKIGTGTTLKVVASGNPLPLFTWSFGGSGLPTGSNLTTTTNINTVTSILGFPSVTASDTGTYKVVITNSQSPLPPKLPLSSSAKLTVK
jgi:hypothetical protein